ncbi:MAG TPA: GntR family transcriptional regulator [Actinomycetota bacterium]|nr:GntR family transcriptional regulator [Actinomycetota bacterium]
MPFNPTDPRPPYRRIAEHLRDLIYSHKLAPGDRLPSERELVEQFGTAQATVRQALAVLKTEGLIDSVHGLGYFVRQPSPVIHRRSSTGHFVQEAKAQGHTGDQRLLEVTGPHDPPPDVAARLDLEDGEHVIVRRYLLLLDDEPAQLADSYFPADLVRDTRIAEFIDIVPGGVHAELQRALSLEVQQFTEDLTTRMPSPQEIQALRLSPGTPVVRLLRTTYASPPGHEDEARPVEVTDYVLAGDKHVLSYQIRATERWTDDGWTPK